MIEPTLKPAPAKPDGYDRRLSALNPNIRVMWNGGLGVWEIQALGRVSREWYYVMLYATIDPPKPPAYLALPPVEEVLRRVHEVDLERLGGTPAKQWGALCTEMDERRKEWLANHYAVLDDAGDQYAKDMFRMGVQGRQHFGPDGRRGKVDLSTGDPVMRRFMAQRARGCAFRS